MRFKALVHVRLRGSVSDAAGNAVMNNTKRYKDMYLCDNGMQLTYAMEDFEYTKWLDPAGVPCYTKDEARSYS